MNKVVEMYFGSKIYGTQTPSSDEDFKSVHIPDGRSIVLGRASQVITDNTKRDTTTKNDTSDVDRESYSLQKFMTLAAEGQTVAMDMLFCPDNMIIFKTQLWEEIQANRHRLITSKVGSFVGYMRTQSAKYGIKGSRVAAVRAIVELFEELLIGFPSHTKVGIFDHMLEDFVAKTDFSHIVDIEQNLQGVPKMIKHLEVCDKKVPFTNTIKEAHAVFKRIFDNYGKRALMAEKNEGIDWKAIGHAVRIGRECIELLETGNITFPRPEAEHLLNVRLGRLDYYKVAEEIEELFLAAEAASAKSTLRPNPDRKWIDNFVYEIYTSEIIRDFSERVLNV